MLRPQPFPLPLGSARSPLLKTSLLLAVGVLSVWGCSSDLASEAAHGGQTGSLIPDCLGSPGQAQVVSGDVALASSLMLEDAILLDSGGNPLATQLEPSDSSDATVIRTEDALTPGTYEVVASCELGQSRRQLIVTEAAQLPEFLGAVEQVGAAVASEQSCERAVALAFTLDVATRPYAALLEVQASFDDGEPFVLIPYGAISPLNSSPYVVNLPRCPNGGEPCVPRTASQLVLHARLAGELEPLPDVTVAVNGECRSAPADETAACGLRRTSPAPTPGQGFDPRALWLGLLFGLIGRRRGVANRRV